LFRFNLNKLKTLDQLNPGEFAIIDSISNNEVEQKLNEMGCVCGEKICIKKVAAFGDPFSINVCDFELCLRKNEAACIKVKLLGTDK